MLLVASPKDKIIGIYRRHASAWGKARTGVLQKHKWLDNFISLLPESASILDLGCGTGLPVAEYFSKQNVAVTGVDTSPEMIAMARKNIPSASWLVADMRGLELKKKFNGIIAWNSSFHLSPDDQRQLFPVLAKHAKGKAVLMFTSGPEHGVAMGEFEGEPLYHASLDPQEYQTLLQKNGFTVIDYVAEDPECGGHTVWLAQYCEV